MTSGALDLLDGFAERVDMSVRAAVEPEDERVRPVALHLVDAGGKGRRPALVGMAALAGSGPHRSLSDEVAIAAAAVEIAHIASLYHDDVIDKAATRRSVPSVHKQWDDAVAILAGDFLLARAVRTAVSVSAEVGALLSTAVARLSEGQLAERRSAFDLDRSEADYLWSIEAKTSALVEAACRIGGVLADGDVDVEALGRFGRAYGIGFQIVDDLLDIAADDTVIGKPTGGDIVEGTFTLPVLRALAGPSGSHLRSLLRETTVASVRDEALRLVRAEGVADTLATANCYFDAADAALSTLRSSAAGELFAAEVFSLRERAEVVAQQMLR